MNILGDYLMYKCYPDYTALRHGLPLDRDTDPELATDKRKGKAITVGLWMFATDSREPMKDVLMRLDFLTVRGLYLILKVSNRLHEYIKRGELYPEQFRYGPDHPPLPNPHLKISNDSSPEQTPEGDPYLPYTFPFVSCRRSHEGKNLDRAFIEAGQPPSVNHVHVRHRQVILQARSGTSGTTRSDPYKERTTRNHARWPIRRGIVWSESHNQYIYTRQQTTTPAGI